MAAPVHIQAEKFDHSIAVLVPASPHYDFDEVFYSTSFPMVHHQPNVLRVVALDVFDDGEIDICCEPLFSSRESALAWDTVGESAAGERKIELLGEAFDDTHNQHRRRLVRAPHVVEFKLRKRSQESVGEIAPLSAEKLKPFI